MVFEDATNQHGSWPPASPQAAVRILQIICLALCAGLLAFSVAVVVIAEDDAAPADIFEAPLPLFGVVFAAITLPISFILPGVVKRQSVAKANIIDDNWVAQNFLSTNLVGYALAEGAGLMNLMFWMVEHSIISPIVAGICLLSIIARFPTQNSLSRFRRECEELHAQRMIP